VWRSVLRWGWLWVLGRSRRNFIRAGEIAALAQLLRLVWAGHPETVLEASMEPGTAIEIRVLEPGER
jgi:hypothetical protein